jgi:hypothetical protein
MWRCLGESVRGTSHVAGGTDCQDACAFRIGDDQSSSLLIFSLSDGAGSAKYSGIASKLTVQRFCTEVERRQLSPSLIDAAPVMEICQQIREEIMAEAAKCSCDIREYAATLLAGCVSNTGGWFFQIGDGAIVTRGIDCYHPATWPDNGEYANSTTFLSSPSWEASCQFVHMDGPINEVGAFTDGLQDLILRHAERSVHEKFLSDLMGAVAQVENVATLAEPMRAFLDSSAINQRTDDDKTLLLAQWQS